MMRQQGFGAIAAIVILVILAVLSAAIVSVGTTQQTGSAQDVMSARAWQAARAGNEWGLYQALKGSWKEGAASDLCPAGGALGPGTAAPPQTLDLTADTGFNVTVTGECWRYNEGETEPGTDKKVLIYRIRAVAWPMARVTRKQSKMSKSSSKNGWLLEQAGIQFVPVHAGLRVVTSNSKKAIL